MYNNHWINAEGLKGWKISLEKVVGGFLWLGFSKIMPELMLCISSDKTTVFDCSSGTVTDTECEYDEDELIALCSDLKDEQVDIAGQYGGTLPKQSPQGDKVISESRKVFEYGKDLVREKVTFITKDGCEQEIYEGYTPYIYGFSNDGSYFVFADDAGLTILKRESLT